MRKYTGEEFPENGRGIVLARALSDEFGYSNGGRTATFIKRIGASELAEDYYGAR